MNKPYVRVTPVGYNTGKVMIGGFYIPKTRKMTDSEIMIQGVLLGQRLPIEVRLKELSNKILSIFRFKH